MEGCTMDFKHILSRNKRSSAPEKRRKPEKGSIAGAHELFLEYEGFLSPSSSRPPRPAAPAQRFPPPPGAAELHPEIKGNLSTEISRDLKEFCDKSRKSIPPRRETVEEIHSEPKRIPSRRKKGLFSLSRPTREQHPDKSSNSLLLYTSEPGNSSHSPNLGWIWRCISTTSKTRQPSPPPSFTTVPPCYECPSFDDDDLTALPVLPGYEKELPPSPEEPSWPSGAAARAAAAAQNEVLDTMRNLKVAEPKLTRDSESGVGIEIRDRAEGITDFDIPMVRKGI